MVVGRFDLPRYLSVLPMFCDCSPPQLARVAQGCQLRRLVKNSVIFRVGDACQELHIVVTGQVKLYVSSPAGQEKVIELVGPGRTFAEGLMFADKPHILNAQTLSDSLLISVNKPVIVAEIESNARFSMRMLADISRHMHGLVRDVEAYTLHSGIQRVIGYLLQNLEGEDATCDNVLVVTLAVSKATLASRLSLTPEYFSRVLHELEVEGLIEVDKRDVRILDTQRLKRYGLH